MPRGLEIGSNRRIELNDCSLRLALYRYSFLVAVLSSLVVNGAENKVPAEHSNSDSANPAVATNNFAQSAQAERDCTDNFKGKDNSFQISINTCDTPDLRQWTTNALLPRLLEWYPKIVALLPSEGFEAPKRVSIRFSERMRGVAATGGTHVTCAAKWFRANLQGEAVGSVVHELVHVVQQYGLARRNNPNAPRSPGWLVEGIADYIRWFLYEPESHGADVVWLQQRHNPELRYNAGYRITANFLDWVTRKHDPELIKHLNAALRNGTYQEDLWQQRTGQTLQQLGDLWSHEIGDQLPHETKPSSPTSGK